MSTIKHPNVWGLSDSDVEVLEKDGSLDTQGHWKFDKIPKAFNSKVEYEATYDGLYMHVFSSLEDLLARKNEKHFYAYSEKASKEAGHEVFADTDGVQREYPEPLVERVLEFEWDGIKHVLKFTPEESDCIHFVESNGIEFCVTYNEDYEDMCVYIPAEGNMFETHVHSVKLPKLEL